MLTPSRTIFNMRVAAETLLFEGDSIYILQDEWF